MQTFLFTYVQERNSADRRHGVGHHAGVRGFVQGRVRLVDGVERKPVLRHVAVAFGDETPVLEEDALGLGRGPQRGGLRLAARHGVAGGAVEVYHEVHAIFAPL